MSSNDDIAVARIRAQIAGARAERCEAHFTSFQVEAVLRQLDAAEARAERAEADGYPAQLAEIRAAVEVYCDPPPNGGHVQAIRRLAAERDRLREERDSLQRWREGILGCEFTRVIIRAAEKLSRPECREVGDGE